jgi:hypothetical protein
MWGVCCLLHVGFSLGCIVFLSGVAGLLISVLKRLGNNFVWGRDELVDLVMGMSLMGVLIFGVIELFGEMWV